MSFVKHSMFSKPSANQSSHDKESRLCFDCVKDQFLRDKIRNEGEDDVCSFCDNSDKTFSLGEVADLVEVAFEEHFERTSTEPSDWDYWRIKEMDYDWDREGEQVHYVIAEIAGIDEDIAAAITDILSDRHSDRELAEMGDESEFDRDSHYQLKSCDGYNHHYREWSVFERRIQSECRFLSRSSQGVLDEVFGGIDRFVTREGKAVVLTVGPQTEVLDLFRARVFQSSEGLIKGLSRPDLEIGPPPLGKAASGRMNAQGISVFYGALSRETALAEVRPPVGSDVVVAKFSILRPLRVLNLAALKQILIHNSYFDPNCRPLLERATFLERLSGQMTRPVMPEREHTDYLVTQVIADYLASEHKLDGLIFPSVQTKDGVNIVLFHHACRTEELEIPEGTDIQVGPDGWSDDGPDPNYLVIELHPLSEKSETKKDAKDNFDPLGIMTLDLPDENQDLRQLSLKVSIKDVEVRKITFVEFSSAKSSVRRESKTKPKGHT